MSINENHPPQQVATSRTLEKTSNCVLLLPSVNEGGGSCSYQLPDIFRALERGEIRNIGYWRTEPNGLDLLKEVIAEMLLDLSEFHGNELGGRSIVLLTQSIISTFSDLSPDEIRLFVSEACSGRWKKFGALTASQVMEWLQAYRAERYQQADEDSYIAHQQAKSDRRPIAEPIVYTSCEAVPPPQRPTGEIDARIKQTMNILYEKFNSPQQQ